MALLAAAHVPLTCPPYTWCSGRRIVFVGCGTSYHASLASRCMLSTGV